MVHSVADAHPSALVRLRATCHPSDALRSAAAVADLEGFLHSKCSHSQRIEKRN